MRVNKMARGLKDGLPLLSEACDLYGKLRGKVSYKNKY